MRKILITGENSYIGKAVIEYSHLNNLNLEFFELDVKSDEWKIHNFAMYDSILHVAAIVHRKETSNMEDLYYKVNAELPFSLALKAKNEGVKQFIFMSTMAVYGEDGKIGQKLVIDGNTKTNPQTFYAKSKLLAEKKIKELISDDFSVTILRPPMVYGDNSPGNFTKLEKLSKVIPIFPNVNNERSMVHIEKLSDSITSVIFNNCNGILFPQDDVYHCTSDIVKKFAEKNGKKLWFSNVLGKLIILFGNRFSVTRKVFGNLVYDKNMEG